MGKIREDHYQQNTQPIQFVTHCQCNDSEKRVALLDKRPKRSHQTSSPNRGDWVAIPTVFLNLARMQQDLVLLWPAHEHHTQSATLGPCGQCPNGYYVQQVGYHFSAKTLNSRSQQPVPTACDGVMSVVYNQVRNVLAK